MCFKEKANCGKCGEETHFTLNQDKFILRQQNSIQYLVCTF